MKRKLLLPVLLIAAALAVAAARPTQSTSTPAVAAVSIPFELINRHIVLQVRVNNSRPLSFVFDTGDKFGIIDLDRAKELGLNLQGQVHVGGAGSGTMAGATIRDSLWMLPGLAGFSQPVVMALPLNAMAAKFGHDFDGIIGSDFIKQFVVEVDYQAKVLRLHDKGKFTYSGTGEAVPIELNQYGYPIVTAEVTPIGGETHKGKFVLDLGSGGCLVLHSPFVIEHRLLDSGLKTIQLIGAGGAGGKTNGQVGRVAALKIGSFKLTNPLTIFSEDQTGALASTELIGNIGEQIASKFKVFLDYDHKRIILEPSATFNEPFDRAQTGFALIAEGRDFATFRITDVIEDSPAFEVGLRKDDIIIKVDDRPASEFSLTKLGEMFERPLTHTLTIRRGDQTLQVKLTPRKLV